MPTPLINRLYEDSKLLLEKLLADGEISLATTVDDIFRKTLLLAAASFFEQAIGEAILEYVAEKADSDAAVVSLTKVKAIDRQYHTYFDWNASNANSFFGHFGEQYKKYAKAKVDGDPVLKESIRAFLEVGSLRNQLVHQNYATFTLEKTADEIYSLYTSALIFIDFLPGSFRDFTDK